MITEKHHIIVGRTPSGAPLYQWEEYHPDGRMRVVRQVWHVVKTRNGLGLGAIRHQEVKT